MRPNALDRRVDRRLCLCLVGDVQWNECEIVTRNVVQGRADLARDCGRSQPRDRPAFSAALTVAAPMPLPAPVMNQTLLMFSSCFRC